MMHPAYVALVYGVAALLLTWRRDRRAWAFAVAGGIVLVYGAARSIGIGI